MQNWKDFVVALCQLGATNTSEQIAETINKHGGSVTKGQVAAVRANYKMGRYND